MFGVQVLKRDRKNENFIKNLPTELLGQIFDLLDVSTQKELMAVCRQWKDVLSTSRYLINQVLQVTTRIAKDTVAAEFEPHPVVEMDIAKFHEDFELCRRYLFEENVAMNLEELHLKGDEKWLVQLLTACGEMNLPQLRKLKICSPLGKIQEPISLIAPKLKSVEIDSEAAGDFGDYLKQQFFDSVEELIVRVQSLRASSTIMKRNFRNLRQLKVAGVMSIFPRHVSQLTHLDLQLRKRPRDILLPSSNLHTLKLSAFRIDISILRPLECLKELSLKVLDPHYEPPIDTVVTLPNLIKLSIDIELAPNFITENLQILDAEVNKVEDNITFMGEYFTSIRQQLRSATFKFEEISSSSKIIDHIHRLTNLKSLSLQKGVVKKAQLERMLASIKLQNVELLSCLISSVETGFFADPYDIDEYFVALKSEYEDCAFSLANLHHVNCPDYIEWMFGDF